MHQLASGGHVSPDCIIAAITSKGPDFVEYSPLAFALDLDAGALHEQMPRALRAAIRYGNVQSLLLARGVATEVYVARISTTPREITRVATFTPAPGMPAEIMIQTAERTFAH